MALVCQPKLRLGDSDNAEVVGKSWLGTCLGVQILQKWAEDTRAAWLGESSHPSSIVPCPWLCPRMGCRKGLHKNLNMPWGLCGGYSKLGVVY